jgi:aspartate aminotransferase
MINETMKQRGANASVIREIFEYAKVRKAQVGADKVYDFSIGNPSVPPPKEVTETLVSLAKNETIHGYTASAGDPEVRRALAEYINSTFSASESAERIYMTCGAAASLAITLRALCNAGDEVIVFAPYFPEYAVFIEAAGAKIVTVKPDVKTFEPDFDDLRNKISDKTKAVIVNSPNNPTGVVYSADCMRTLASVLNQSAYKNDIYLVSDEPYRELVYDGARFVYAPDFYDKTIVCYSFSKSLSLPGERIGYICVTKGCRDDVFDAVCGAGRSLGYVCAPALFQRLAAKTVGKTSDFGVYERNRRTLIDALSSYGYEVVDSKGAFYLFVKSPSLDSAEFYERAKKHDVLIVPSDSFGWSGYARIAYCVSEKQVKDSLVAFKKIIEEYGEQ